MPQTCQCERLILHKTLLATPVHLPKRLISHLNAGEAGDRKNRPLEIFMGNGIMTLWLCDQRDLE